MVEAILADEEECRLLQITRHEACFVDSSADLVWLSVCHVCAPDFAGFKAPSGGAIRCMTWG